MNNNTWLMMGLGAFLAASGGCQVEKIDPPLASGAGAVPAVIATSMDGAKAASQVMQTAEFISTSAGVLQSLGADVIHVMTTDPTVTLTASVPCSDYGEYTYKGTVSSTGSFDLELTYALCRNNGMQFDGTLTALGTADNMSVSLGETGYLRLIDYDSKGYKAITGILTLTGLSYKMTASVDAAGGTYGIKPAGQIKAFDYVTLGSFTVYFGSLQYNVVISTNTTAGTKTTSVVANGSMRQTWTGGMALLSLTGFEVFRAEQGAGGNYTSGDLSVLGTAQFDFGSATAGLEGILTMSTTTSVHTDYATGATTAGAITFNGTGSATALYNANSSIDVSATGITPVGYAGQYYLNAVVNFYGFEQTTPTLMGKTGNISPLKAIGSVWNATMTVTALSSGSDLNCFTDVHVNYYAPADLSLIVWYVDWHVAMSCTSPPGIPFEQATDINGNATCDAGLDINGADQDITSGGVEHFTATDLPQGYYVVSINNWSCGTATTNQATIIIGDYLFGTYDCTYTASDGENGHTPGAWCRLADVRVNADGSADVLAPDATFLPWHN